MKRAPSPTNATTNAIISYLTMQGGVAMRNQTGGVFDPRTGRFRTAHRTSIGSGDVLACWRGLWIEVEVKTGRDSMSDGQWQRKERIEKAGGAYFIAHTFDEFKKWFDLFMDDVAGKFTKNRKANI